MAEPARSRRSLLGTLTAAALGAAGLWRYLSPRSGASTGGSAPPRPRGPSIVVRAGDVPAEGALVLPDQRTAVVRLGSELLAFDLSCPHLGCVALGAPGGFVCPCHGSRFTSRGEVLNGPAPRGLRPLELQREGDVLRIWRA